MLIQVSFHSLGMPQSCWVSAEVLAGKTAGCISQHKQDGTPIYYKVKGYRDPQRRMLNVKNILERGIPQLADGWQERAQTAHESIWRELMPNAFTQPAYALSH